MMKTVANFRNCLAILLSMLPPLSAQAEKILSQTDGNFELKGTVRSAAIVHFRAKSGLGYRLALTSRYRLDDPGRRPGVLAESDISATTETVFRLVANG